MHRRWLPLVAGCLLAACSGGGGSGAPFGLTQRVEVTGLAFPATAPSAGQLAFVNAFPNLSFQNPVFVTAAPDGTDRLFVVEQAGRVLVFDNDPSTTTAGVFLDIRGRVVSGGERGLLGLAFHPDYASNGRFYVYYSAAATSGGNHRSVVARFDVTADPDVADAASEVVLLAFTQPYSNHNGGMLAFGPDDKLYVAAGDGGSGGDPDDNAQDLTNLLGKILRLEPDGSVPADNPFVATPGARGEIWAYGLRNPWRFSFDGATLYCGDVGQGSFEEIDVVQRGGNHGWRLFEGDAVYNNPSGTTPADYVAPSIVYGRSSGASVTGGYVYRGADAPSLAGRYVYADFVSGRIWSARFSGSTATDVEQLFATGRNISSFGTDRDGELHFTAFDGRVYKFEETPGGPVAFPQTLSATGLFADTAGLVPAAGLVEYDVQVPFFTDGALKRRWIALPGRERVTFRATGAWDFPRGTVLVKHFELAVAPGQRRRLETRVLVHEEDGWRGYLYRWNAAQTDADLIDDAEAETYVVQDPAAPGGQRMQTWTFPSRADCLTCHTAAAGRVLGLRTRQLNRTFPYPAATDNQLRAWNHVGLFTTDIGDPTAYDAFPRTDDADAPLDDRARAWIDANCAYCHLPGGPTPTDLDLRYGIAEAAMNAFGVEAANPVDGLQGRLRIDPGSREGSDVWERIRRLDQFQMPQLGRNEVDREAEALLGAWIDAK